MSGKTIAELKIGDKASFTKTITEADVCLFAGVSGDMNPLHINDEAGKASMFKRRIAHGMLSASLISTVLGTGLPGTGTLYLGQNLKFTAPVYLGETVTAEVEVSELRTDKNIAILKTTCTNAKGDVVISGEATVMPPKA